MPSLSNNNIEVQISTTADTEGITKVRRSIDDLTGHTETAMSGLSTRTAAIAGLVAGAAQTLVQTGINVITSSLGDAIKRVDTLKNAQQTFLNMGFSAQVASGMMNELKSSILGLPTSLSDAVGGVELLAGATGDIGKSREIFTALNDGILGFGGSANMVNGAVIQLSQALSNGKVDAQTWNSLIQAGMGPALNSLAKTMGITAGALKDGLSTGKISASEFEKQLISLDKNGGGGMASLHKIAKDSTNGIGTGIENAKTAVVRGLANIITAFGASNISTAISAFGTDFEKAEKSIATAIKDTIVVIKDIIKFSKDHKKILTEIVGVITALFLPGMIAFGIQSAITFALYTAGVISAGVSSLIAGGQMALAWIMALGPIGLIIAAVAIAAVLIIANFDSIKKFVSRVWSDIKQWGVDAWQGIVSAWQGAGNWFGNIFSGITKWASDTVDGIVDFFKKLPGRITGAIGNIASNIGGDIKNIFKKLHIPGFATGVQNFSGGLAIVGEQGPELVNLPSGSSVHSNHESQMMMGQHSGGNKSFNHYGDVYLGDKTAVNEYFKQIDRDNILLGKGLSPVRGMN